MTQNKYMRYIVAPVAVALALVCRLALNPILHDASPFMVFFVAIIVSGWLGGLGPGLLATVLSALAVDYFYLPPVGSIVLGSTKEFLQSIPFLLLGTVVCVIVERMRREQRRAEQAAGEARAGESIARQAGEALRQSEERWATTLASIGDAVIATDVEGRVIFMNAVAENLTGWRLTEALTRPIIDVFNIINEDTRAKVEAPVTKVLREGKVVGLANHTVLVRRDKTEAPIDDSGAPIRDRDGRIVGVVLVFRDITERKQAEVAAQEAARSLEREKNLLQSVMNGAKNSHLVYLDRAFNFVRVNEAYARTCGYKPQEMIGKNHFALYPHEENEAIFACVRDTGKPAEYHDKPFVFPDQPERGVTYWDWTLNPVTDGSGNVAGLVFSLVETTERKRAEDRLRDSERRQADIIEFLPDATFALDNEGRIIAWNKAMEELTGAPAVEVLGKGNHEHTFWLYGKRIPCLADAIMKGEEPGWSFSNLLHEEDTLKAETFVPHLKPGGVWLSIKVARMYDAQGNVVGVIDSCRDITEQMRNEETLRESETRYRSLFENMQEGFAYCQMLFDDHGHPEDFAYLQVNDAFGRLTGLKDVVGRKVTDVITGIREAHPELFEIYGRVATTGKPERFEIEFKPLGLWLSVSVHSPGRGYFVSAFDNITQRKQDEQALQAANSRLLESDRRKNEFLAMLAHELRNPLTPVRYAVQLMNSYCGPVCPSHERSAHQRDIIERQIGHMARLIDDLLDVARISRGKIDLRKDMIDLSTVLHHSFESCRQAMENKHQELIASLPEDPLWLEGDRTRLEQVFTNLLGNAIKYSPAGNRIWVSMSVESAADDQSTAVVRVRDEGEGISSELLPQIFELFTQGERGLDRTQGGLGIGLTMVQKLVELHGGRVEARSDGPGKGSEFVVRLPMIVETDVTITTQRKAESSAINRPLKILAVDDVVDTAQSLADLPNMWGHEARAAFDGSAALEITRTWKPEVVLLDIGMPGMDGYEVARRLRTEHRGESMTLIALTGYGQISDRAEAQAAGFNDLLVKPVELDALREVLAKIL